MIIAIQPTPGGFSDRWLEYCKEKQIPFKIVNAYASDIIKQVEDCDIFMWHYRHDKYQDNLFAKQLMASLQQAGKKVYPDISTGWHFDDKVGQKYLLESIGAPLVPSYVFYEKQDALAWIENTSFPKVFKLRGGAGASNVKLIKSKSQARTLIKRAFGRGLGGNRLSLFLDELKRYKQGHSSSRMLYLRLGNVFVPTLSQRMSHREKGYVYFQDFIPNNNSDLRVVVIGNRLLAEKRYCRKGDFRASGSGVFEYTTVPDEVIEIAFSTAKRLSLQSVAFDFIFDNNKPLIVEMSYAFGFKGLSHCPGYYTRDKVWHECNNPDFLGWILEDLLYISK